MNAGVLPATDQFRELHLLAGALDTARLSRRMAEKAMNEWGLHHLVDDVVMCVSELVGNAVRHATPDGWVPSIGGERHIGVALLVWENWLFLEVCDEDSTPPMLPVGDLFAFGLPDDASDAALPSTGRGLYIVQHLAESTWWTPREYGGKSVFCRFDLDRKSSS